MSNTKVTPMPSEADVISNVAAFIEDAIWRKELRNMPANVQEMFENLIEADDSIDLPTLRRILATVKTIRSFGETLEPFTDEQITNACNAVRHA